MYIDHNEIDSFPFNGTFFRNVTDESKPLIEQVEERREILQTKCDIVEGGHSRSRTFISADWEVNFPFDKECDTILVRRGDVFSGEMYGVLIEGKVIGVFPNQLGGCIAYIEDMEV